MNAWPKYDPQRGLWLCKGCWNNGNWSHHCFGIYDCPRCNGPWTRKTKFTGEGQTSFSDWLRPKSGGAK